VNAIKTTPEEQEIIQTLERVDWDFPGSGTPLKSVHSLHRFPGNFIPQIPMYLIQLLSASGAWVLDPFCGSGTTGVEAIRLGRRAWLSDANRASIQVTRGKIAAIVAPEIAGALRTLLQELIWEELLRSHRFGRNNEGSAPELQAWFYDDTLAQLRYIWDLVENAPDNNLRAVLELIFSDTLFACASPAGAPTSTGRRRRHHWGWIADNVRPKNPAMQNAIGAFRERLVHVIDVLETVEAASWDAVTIQREDARALSMANSSVDLVVTSPPYLGMIDYALANRLTYLWMGWPLHEDQQVEIGARYRRDKRSALDEYLQSMSQAVHHIVRSLRPGGYCAIIIGSSRKYPQAANMIVDLFGRELRTVWGPKPRIPSKRRVSERLGREPVEWLCVFRKVPSF
jgi:hypothetical protein